MNSANVDLSNSAISIFNAQKPSFNNAEVGLDYTLEQSNSYNNKSFDDTTSPNKLDSVAAAEQAIASAINLGNKYDRASKSFPWLSAALCLLISLYLLAIIGYMINPVMSAEIFVSQTGWALLGVFFIEILLLFKLNYLKNKQNEWCKLALALAPKSRKFEYEVRVLLIKSGRYSINKNLKEIEKIREKYQADPSNPWMKKLDVLEAQILSRKYARYNKR